VVLLVAYQVELVDRQEELHQGVHSSALAVVQKEGGLLEEGVVLP